MLNKLRFFFLLIITQIQFFLPGCSRDNPAVVTDTKTINKIFPLEEYNLDIPEPSGITYNSKNNTLMVVSDGESNIYEIAFNGAILNSIPTSGSDMEGITLSKNCDTIFVVEEKKKLVTAFDLSGNKITSFSVNVSTSDNHSLEGISLNILTNELFVINEKNPQMILKFLNKQELWRKSIAYTLDISDICYDETSNCIWIISDESKRILKLSTTGELLKEWEIPFTKGEGITIVNEKIYVVNDSNSKMYVFQKPN
ncbi:MAG: SdiA-regulated domain-containing protein [Ignavibacterium sp.]|nr:SdiA-regulated domain-containing protein [Ignavibacterium sp.]